MSEAAGLQTNIPSLVDDTTELPAMPEVLVDVGEVGADPNAPSQAVAAAAIK